MQLTILGNNGPFQSAGGACSGYLITEGDTRILIDCGNGVLGNLLKFTRFEELDAIILTHLHSDHISDMLVLKYAVEIKINKGMMNKPIKIYLPDEPLEEFKRFDVKGVFDVQTISESLMLQFGDLKINFKQMKHPVKCFGISVSNGTRRFVFSGDTSWTEDIIEFAENCDMLMLDSGLLADQKTNENVPHLTSRECGIIAKQARVKRLLLTHFWPETAIGEYVKEARENFKDTEASVLLAVYEI